MKIVHLCLANFYIDNYSYQENMLPKMHKQLGYDVEIVASTETFVDGIQLGYLKPSSYINEYGIKVTRLPYVKYLPSKFAHKLRVYPGIYDKLEDVSPDVIFMHGGQFLSIGQVERYVKLHPKVTLYIDSHADFSNSAKTFVSKNILHKMIYKYGIKRINPYVKKWYGVLPARVDFLKDVYGLPAEKIEFLPMGADDDMVEKYSSPEIRVEYRRKYGVEKDDFLLVTGGKINFAKTQTLLLMDAINQIDNPKLKLIIFGSIAPELKSAVEERCSEKVKYIGWLSPEESYPHFAMADLAAFPGRHSVYWEQVAGIGIPMLVKSWPGTTHVDRGGNVLFLHEDSVDEIKRYVTEIVNGKINQMKYSSVENRSYFCYRKIAEKSLQ